MPGDEPTTPRPRAEVLATHRLATVAGAEVVGCLGAVCATLLVALVVSVVAGAPPALEPWVWAFPAGAALVAAAALRVHARRQRTLRIVRVGTALRLVVGEGGGGALAEVDLAIPLHASGAQRRTYEHGVAVQHVYLKLRADDGRCLVLEEQRGGEPEPGWFQPEDPSALASQYYVRQGQAARIRFRVEELRSAAPPASAPPADPGGP